MAKGKRRAPYPPPDSPWKRPLTPIEVGGLLAGLALLLACCGLCCGLGAVLPRDAPPPIVYVTPSP